MLIFRSVSLGIWNKIRVSVCPEKGTADYLKFPIESSAVVRSQKKAGLVNTKEILLEKGFAGVKFPPFLPSI